MGLKAKIRVKVAGRPAEQKNSTKFIPKAKTITPPKIPKLKGDKANFSA